TRKQIREAIHWGNTQLKIHLGRLEEMEYLLVHRGGRGNSIVYELLYDGAGESGKNRLYGLIEPQALQYDSQKSGVNPNQSGPGRPQVGEVSGAGRSQKKAETPINTGSSHTQPEKPEARTIKASNKNNGASYRTDTISPLAAEGSH
ncbi:MAG: DNA primase, partial [Bacteroidetes bacterium]